MRDHFHAESKAVEVHTLGALQRERSKERNDLLKKIRTPPYDVAAKILTMVVVPPVDEHLANPEKASKLLEATKTALALDDSELVSHLEASPVAASAFPVRLPDEAD